MAQSYKVGTVSRVTIENELLPKLELEYLRTPAVKAAIKRDIEMRFPSSGKGRLNAQTTPVDSAGKKAFEEEREKHYMQEFLNAVRTQLMINLLKVVDDKGKIGVVKDGKPRSIKGFDYDANASIAGNVATFNSWRRENGFNSMLLVTLPGEDHKRKTADASQAAEEKAGKPLIVPQPPKLVTLNYVSWLKRMHEHWAMGIPVDGMVEMGSMQQGTQYFGRDSRRGECCRQEHPRHRKAPR